MVLNYILVGCPWYINETSLELLLRQSTWWSTFSFQSGDVFLCVYSHVTLTNETLIKNAQFNVLVKSQFGFGNSHGCCAVLIVVKREKIAKAKQGTSNLRLSLPLFGVLGDL